MTYLFAIYNNTCNYPISRQLSHLSPKYDQKSYFFEHRIAMILGPKPQRKAFISKLLWGPDGGTRAGIGGCGAGVNINL
jgi:hypothetical protein